eukprot:sb/3472133/
MFQYPSVSDTACSAVYGSDFRRGMWCTGEIPMTYQHTASGDSVVVILVSRDAHIWSCVSRGLRIAIPMLVHALSIRTLLESLLTITAILCRELHMSRDAHIWCCMCHVMPIYGVSRTALFAGFSTVCSHPIPVFSTLRGVPGSPFGTPGVAVSTHIGLGVRVGVGTCRGGD